MSILKRGEVWYARISDPETSRAALGSEMGAKVEKGARPYRCCVVVSSTIANESRPRVTVVPLTDYDEFKEIPMGRLGFKVEHDQHIEFDPNNGNYADGRLREGTDPKTRGPYRSMVDCGQLRTISAPTDTERQVNSMLRDDAVHRNGRLLRDVPLGTVLNFLLGDNPSPPLDRKILPYQEGEIFALDLPGRMNQRCVIVSSSVVDYERAEIYVKKLGRPLGHVTVVPLVPPGAPSPIDVRARVGGGEHSEEIYASCGEIYTVDWFARRPSEVLGRVTNLAEIRAGVHLYLDLPRLGPSEPDRARKVPWAHMAEALAAGCRANAARDIEVGFAFDEVQQESYRSWDAWDRELDAATGDRVPDLVSAPVPWVPDLNQYRRQKLYPDLDPSTRIYKSAAYAGRRLTAPSGAEERYLLRDSSSGAPVELIPDRARGLLRLHGIPDQGATTFVLRVGSCAAEFSRSGEVESAYDAQLSQENLFTLLRDLQRGDVDADLLFPKAPS